ncbi:MAG: hypothetical protein WCQ50_19760, partial [Spirochaetota bacterium]
KAGKAGNLEEARRLRPELETREKEFRLATAQERSDLQPRDDFLSFTDFPGTVRLLKQGEALDF